jgi:hypothetical protein
MRDGTKLVGFETNTHTPSTVRGAWLVLGMTVFLWISANTLAGAEVGHVPGQLLVKPNGRVAEGVLQGLFAAQGGVESSRISQLDIRLVHVPEERLSAVFEALSHHPNIAFAEPDYIFPPDTVPNDTYYSSAWHLPKVDAPTAWDSTTGSSNVIIAILDTGVESSHPDLAPKLVGGWNFFDDNSDTRDVWGHGTAVAGTAAACSNNGLGVAGLAWGCRLMPIRVTDTNAYGYLSAMARGLTYAADHGARVANLSFRVSGSATLSNAAQYFQSKGGVVTVSAGNEAVFDDSPEDPSVLTVSATDANDALASFSNTGNNVDVSAPGVNILTTAVGGSYGFGTGTSFSAPIVAGVAALVISANPSLSGQQIQNIIRTSADDLGAPGWDSIFGSGRVNAARAVQVARNTSGGDVTAPSVSINSPAGGSTLTGAVAVTVDATDNTGVIRIELLVDGVVSGTNASPPASFSWDTTRSANGAHNLQARAYDAAGNIGASTLLAVTVQNPVPDTTPPTASLMSPSNNCTVAGIVNIAVSGSDNVAVTRVEWWLDGVKQGSNAAASASFSWDTRAVADGSHTLQSRAYDAAGNMGASSLVTATVKNSLADLIAPTAQITSPTNGLHLGKSTKVYVTSTDNVGVTKVDLLVDGKYFATSFSAAPVFTWNTSKIKRGSHTLQAVAYDAAANAGRSSVVTVYK